MRHIQVHSQRAMSVSRFAIAGTVEDVAAVNAAARLIWESVKLHVFDVPIPFENIDPEIRRSLRLGAHATLFAAGALPSQRGRP